jgi:hypothetical protein
MRLEIGVLKKCPSEEAAGTSRMLGIGEPLGNRLFKRRPVAIIYADPNLGALKITS